jgi:hypothetical protein
MQGFAGPWQSLQAGQDDQPEGKSQTGGEDHAKDQPDCQEEMDDIHVTH